MLLLALAPEGLQVVVAPLVGGQHMDDQFAVIEHHPTAVVLALLAQGQPTGLLFELVLHRPGDGPHLHVGEAAADHKPVGQRGDGLDADQADINGLAVIAGLRGHQGQGAAVQPRATRGDWGGGSGGDIRFGDDDGFGGQGPIKPGDFSHRRSHY